MIVRIKSLNRYQCVSDLRNIYGEEVNFCYLGNQLSAIVGVSSKEEYLSPILFETTAPPLWQAAMNMQMGIVNSHTYSREYPVAYTHKADISDYEYVHMYGAIY